ncbi:SPV120 hypothetical protein [Swinepox virus]|uniref:C-type lectin domain-containing protein n=2 Tax=Swinepox virus TaxID=10276 RepID=Q8V3H6_SWPV1|nr:IEV and EEV membrane glycoprotein [Swinepox virus]AAL69859.1 SPV120 hypothetical protein [Swinepox virus]AVV65615.1 hypothetical protein [Swinepox virus]UED36639.1 IEV and EEV membrane glycoprotein [Swinepox virus]UED36788.1 IEV and EEV membrane glycoprotein [Swinepox virus]UUA44310.1 SPV120 [Swinepox virus]
MKLNRQTVNKFKRLTTPAAIFMIISTIVSGIGTILKYKNELFPSACTKGWLPYDNYCYLDTRVKLTIYGALSLCNTYNAKIPKTNFRHLKVMSLTYGKQFWVSLSKQGNSWIDININKTVDMSNSIELTKIRNSNNNKNECCYTYKMGELKETVCNIVNYILCVKRFYN